MASPGVFFIVLSQQFWIELNNLLKFWNSWAYFLYKFQLHGALIWIRPQWEGVRFKPFSMRYFPEMSPNTQAVYRMHYQNGRMWGGNLIPLWLLFLKEKTLGFLHMELQHLVGLTFWVWSTCDQNSMFFYSLVNLFSVCRYLQNGKELLIHISSPSPQHFVHWKPPSQVTSSMSDKRCQSPIIFLREK